MKTRDELKTHTLADIVPLMSDEEFERLKEDIKTNGLSEPITLHERKILDGRHRFRACLELNVEPCFEEWNGPGSPLTFVLAKNLHRRHLTQTQCAVLAAKLIPEFELEARENMSRGGQGLAIVPTLHSRDRAAEVARVSSRLAGLAAVVLEKGVPALVAAVERSEIKVSPAAAVAALDPEVQERLVVEGPKAVRSRAAELRRPKAPSRTPDATIGPDVAESVRFAAPPDNALTDLRWLEGFRSGVGSRTPASLTAARTWRRLSQLQEEMLRDYPDVAAGELSRSVAYNPPSVWFGTTDPGPDPSTWVFCSVCDGAGDDHGDRCCQCSGDGFLTRTLDPLESPPG